MQNTQREAHLSTRTTRRMLTTPKAAASSAGAVYMLSCRSMNFTVTPFSPINDRHACNANVCRDTTAWTHTLVLKVWDRLWTTWSQDETQSLTGAHVSHSTGPLLQWGCPCNIGPYHSNVTCHERPQGLIRLCDIIYKCRAPVFRSCTCSKAHESSGHQHVELVVFGRQVGVRIVDICRQIDEDGADQRLSSRPVVGPKSKERRSHHLTEAVGSNNPSQEAGISADVDLSEASKKGSKDIVGTILKNQTHNYSSCLETSTFECPKLILFFIKP